VLLHRPDWILMHDASSALSPEAGEALIALIAEILPGSAWSPSPLAPWPLACSAGASPWRRSRSPR